MIEWFFFPNKIVYVSDINILIHHDHDSPETEKVFAVARSVSIHLIGSISDLWAAGEGRLAPQVSVYTVAGFLPV